MSEYVELFGRKREVLKKRFQNGFAIRLVDADKAWIIMCGSVPAVVLWKDEYSFEDALEEFNDFNEV